VQDASTAARGAESMATALREYMDSLGREQKPDPAVTQGYLDLIEKFGKVAREKAQQAITPTAPAAPAAAPIAPNPFPSALTDDEWQRAQRAGYTKESVEKWLRDNGRLK
jgi:hypothetical protein